MVPHFSLVTAPMCSRKLTDLTPEASLYSQQDAEVIEVLKKVRKYTGLFIGGTYGLMLMFLGLLHTLSPFDFLRIGCQNVIDVLDYSAIALSSVLYLVGLYLRRRRFHHVREMAAADFAARWQLPADEADICSQLIVELEDFGFPKILLCFCGCVLWQV